MPEFQLSIRPGDTCQIFPKNFPDDVDALIERMKWGDQAHTPVMFSGLLMTRPTETCIDFDVKPPNMFCDKGATVRSLLLNNYDITAVPKRSFLEKIKFFTTNEDHKERLQELISPDGSPRTGFSDLRLRLRQLRGFEQPL